MAFFGCKAEQVNREFRPNLEMNKRYGSLTYFLIQGMKNLKSNATYANLFSEIRKNMVIEFKNAQHPEIEGDDLNQLIFSGEFKAQEQFFELKPSIYARKATLKAGKLQGIMSGDSIALFENTVNRIEEGTPIMKGVIEKSTPLESTILLNNALPNGKDVGALYRVFKVHDASLDIELRVKLDVSGGVRNKLKNAIKDMPNVYLENKDYQYLVQEVNHPDGGKGVSIYLGSDSQKPLRNMTPFSVDNPFLVDSVIQLITEASRVNALRRINSSSFDIDFEIVITDFNKNELSIENMLKMNENDTVRIFIKNVGEKPFYVSMINIAANNKIEVVSESSSAFIPVGVKKHLKGMVLSDLGIDHYKFIASTSFIDLKPFGNLGSDLSEGTRGSSDNFFADFINDNVEGTRGSAIEDVEITIKAIEFDVVGEK